jgi:hypothetical protein
MSARRRSDGSPPPPVFRYVPLGELKVYQVQEHELELLASGSPSSVYLNFALCLLPVGVTLIVTLATTNIPSDRLFLTFVAVATVSLIAGLVLLLLWWRNYRGAKLLLAEIKNRMPPPEPIAQTPPDAPGTTQPDAGPQAPGPS